MRNLVLGVLLLLIGVLLALNGCATRRSACGNMNKIDCDKLQRDMDKAGSSDFGAGKSPS